MLNRCSISCFESPMISPALPDEIVPFIYRCNAMVSDSDLDLVSGEFGSVVCDSVIGIGF